MSSKLERVLCILFDINRGTYPSLQDLCNKYEIAERTLHDDIRFIKDRLRFEVLYDRGRNGYYNSTPDRKLPEFDLSEDELLALTLGKDMLIENSGPVFKYQIERALEKIAGRLVQKEQISVDEIRALVKVVPRGVARADTKVMLELRGACASCRSVEINYYSAHSGITSTRKIDPYRIIEHSGAWYAVAYCHQRKDVVKFAVHRIRESKVLKESFTVKEGFDVDAWMASAFMLEHGDGEQNVIIRFTPIGARFALERQWHPSQKVQVHPDGSCTLEFKTQSFDEVKRWVLPYGSGAEVLEPPELRKRVMDELRQTLRGYGVKES
ncbi:MAG: WYL domain-containing protein [Candidatus Obscuribacterales bacterium]|nr:WYL domain-containing protein [Candidatus Obscuribacterales bacterium]